MKGTMTFREVQAILRANGYYLDRTESHYIYKNEDGDTFILPRSCNDMLLRRMFKEHAIEKDVKKAKKNRRK